MAIKVLYAGDTQTNLMTSIKGIDSWSFAYSSDSAQYLRDALNEDPEIVCDHIRDNEAITKLPSIVEDFEKYDCFIISDLGYNNIVFQPGNVAPYRIPMGPDRVGALHDYVMQGGGFMMIGGWLSFSGLQGKGIYGGTKIEDLLPVKCEPRGVDDRMEITEGFIFDINKPNHPIVEGLPWNKPYMFLGYNKTYLKDDAELIASFRGDPQIAIRNVGKGRTAIFAPDLAPHWAGNFIEWPGYKEFCQRLVKWLVGNL